MSSGKRLKWSQASPLGSAHGVPSACSHSHQSLFQLPPSTWWAAVAVPHTNPSGNEIVGMAVNGRRSRWRRGCENAAVTAALDDLIDLLDLEPIEVNIFR